MIQLTDLFVQLKSLTNYQIIYSSLSLKFEVFEMGWTPVTPLHPTPMPQFKFFDKYIICFYFYKTTLFLSISSRNISATAHLPTALLACRKYLMIALTLKAPIPQNGQTHSNNSSAIADELFECV